jgi:hypothetical protein
LQHRTGSDRAPRARRTSAVLPLDALAHLTRVLCRPTRISAAWGGRDRHDRHHHRRMADCSGRTVVLRLQRSRSRRTDTRPFVTCTEPTSAYRTSPGTTAGNASDQAPAHLSAPRWPSGSLALRAPIARSRRAMLRPEPHRTRTEVRCRPEAENDEQARCMPCVTANATGHPSASDRCGRGWAAGCARWRSGHPGPRVAPYRAAPGAERCYVVGVVIRCRHRDHLSGRVEAARR